MAFADFQAKQRYNKLSAVMREYFTKYDGQALCLSDDQTFTALLANTLKNLGVSQERLLVVIADAAKTLKAVGDSFAAGKKPVLFVERVLMETGDTSFLVKQCRETHPEVRIIVMTTEADRDRIMLLHESGADNFLLKPLSANDLMEKMAETLRPPGTIRQLLDKARSFIVRDKARDALTITGKVLEVKPDNAAGYVVQGDALHAAGGTDQAREAYVRASKLSDTYLEPLQRLADLARESGDRETQLDYLKRMDAISPLNTRRKVEIGELHVALGNTETAGKVFDAAVSRAHREAIDQVVAMTRKIAMSLQEADPVQAEKYLRQCLSMRGDDLTINDLTTFNQLGISLRKQGRWRDAILEYQKALKIAPRSEGLYYNMGMAFMEGGDTERAIASMQKALAINPDMPRGGSTLAYNIGMVLAQGYTWEKAMQCMEIVLELEPGHPQARAVLDKLKQRLDSQEDQAHPISSGQ